ncbi:peptidase T [Olsenella sp. An188]|uniref:peptidase T n=1 Tax=Olsenella sp. An188 TaxID=1965579 RepID=UPI000B37E5DD|nr:peptidase T [Olsenella sp. An188]OUP39797.1 peptidase T [Olsenella sp. An188]
MSDVLERFVRYCEVPSQSNPQTADHVPSTQSQFKIAEVVAEDLRALGAEDVSVDEHAYVTCHWPASVGAEELPTLGFCCHLDTAWQSWGDPVRPRVVRYEGGELAIGTGPDGRPVTLSPDVNPELERMVGGELVVTDGTSLLGGDDKAGVAECVALLARLRENPELPHPRLALAFVPDEEIGHGAALLDLEAFGADFGYTIDGGPLGEFCYETFNAAEAELTAHGVSVHTGTAKGKMVNASEAIMRFHQLLPAAERPEFTEGYDGFFYLERMEGSCEEASAAYIIRDHDQAQVERRKDLMRAAAALVNAQMGEGTLELAIHDQYHNLADVVCLPENAHLIDNARAAYAACGVEMTCVPMRGGTDGSQLSFRGFPCANLSAGYYNAHGVREFVPVAELERMVDVLQDLVGRYARPQA